MAFPLDKVLAIGSSGVMFWTKTFFFPLSHTGIRPQETVSVNGTNRWLRTLPLSAYAAAVVRLVRCGDLASFERHHLIGNLMDSIVYSMFNQSYDGDFRHIPGNEVPLSEKEIQDMVQARETIRAWDLRPTDQWIKEIIIGILTGASVKGLTGPIPGVV